MIIGLTGTLAAGKGTVAKILQEKGFIYHSLSDAIREEADNRGVERTRENLQALGNELRKTHGAGVLAIKTIQKLIKGQNTAIDSIRNTAEIKELRKNPEFFLIGVDADIKIRFERASKRQREKEAMTLQGFIASEKKELTKKGTGQQLGECMKKADAIIKNETSLRELREKLEKALEQAAKKTYRRPTWDEYFIEIMQTVGRRATCNRGRSGCVIVKNNHILVTGYVGSPAGIVHCDDVGHEIKKTIHEDGKESQHCVRTAHAEQNAICHAAKLGIPLNGSTLYCRMTPCYTCAKMIINCGIRRVVCMNDYHASKETKRVFKEAGVKLEIMNKDTVKYKNM